MFLLIAHGFGIVKVGHRHTLYLMMFQGHVNGHIKVKIKEGGSKHTTLLDPIVDSNTSEVFSYALAAATESSCKALMIGNNLGWWIVQALKYGSQGVTFL